MFIHVFIMMIISKTKLLGLGKLSPKLTGQIYQPVNWVPVILIHPVNWVPMVLINSVNWVPNIYTLYLRYVILIRTVYFTQSVWAAFKTTLNRTANSCEWFHSRLNGIFHSWHPNIDNFTDVLENVQIRKYIDT